MNKCNKKLTKASVKKDGVQYDHSGDFAEILEMMNGTNTMVKKLNHDQKVIHWVKTHNNKLCSEDIKGYSVTPTTSRSVRAILISPIGSLFLPLTASLLLLHQSRLQDTLTVLILLLPSRLYCCPGFIDGVGMIGLVPWVGSVGGFIVGVGMGGFINISRNV